MSIELTRLAFGFLLLIFHRPIADYILKQERALVLIFRQRGLRFPFAPDTETMHNIYFILGTFVILYELARIWLLLHP